MHLALAPIAVAPARAAMPSRASLGPRAPLAPRPFATPARRSRHGSERGVLLAPRAALPDPAAVNDALFQLAGNANELVDGCGVNGTCGQVAAPPFALIGTAILISGAFLAFVTFGMKGGADAASEMQQRDKDFFGKK